MEDGEVAGFHPDIAQSVFTDEFGYEYSCKDTSFDGIVESLKDVNFRVIVSAMTSSETRAEQIVEQNAREQFFTNPETERAEQFLSRLL